MNVAKDKDQVYRIYSHADADGGIAAAIYANHLLSEFGNHGWQVEYFPVQHGSGGTEWSLKEIQWPCAILDFTLHPAFFSDRFYQKEDAALLHLGDASKVPKCAWIDHHPTGSSYQFLTSENLSQYMPRINSCWDVAAISTPGLFRMHAQRLGLPEELLLRYQEYIDLADIIDGALYATAEAAHDFSSPTIKLQTLFSSHHPCIDKNSLYKRLVMHIEKDPLVESLFDADPLYSAILQWESALHSELCLIYKRVIEANGIVAVANFMGKGTNDSMGRFIPYLLMPEANYAIHVMPRKNGSGVVSCGINPWNKPAESAPKHLGNYFAQHFNGGGHAFVAGGRIVDGEQEKIAALVAYLNS